MPLLPDNNVMNIHKGIVLIASTTVKEMRMHNPNIKSGAILRKEDTNILHCTFITPIVFIFECLFIRVLDRSTIPATATFKSINTNDWPITELAINT